MTETDRLRIYPASEELPAEWPGGDAFMFRSQEARKEIIGGSPRIESLETWEMECFDKAWTDRPDTDNEYAAGDKQFFDTHVKPYTCLVGIYIKIR